MLKLRRTFVTLSLFFILSTKICNKPGNTPNMIWTCLCFFFEKHILRISSIIFKNEYNLKNNEAMLVA